MPHYIALIDGEPGAYGAVFPDLPGCTSGAESLDAIVPMAIEALALWAESALAAGEMLPVARDMGALRADPEVKEAIAEGAMFAVVPLLLDSGRSARVNISLDAGLLASIDEAAGLRGLTRSGFLASAARQKIEAEG